MKNIDVSAIIVTYNSEQVIKACLDSIFRETTRHSFEILISDNGSTDQTVKIVHEQPKINLIENNANLGFAKANNLALKQATGKYILFLNPDTEVKNGAIDILLDKMETDQNIHMATGAIFYPDGRRQPNIKRHPTRISELLIALKLTRLPRQFKSMEKYLARDFDYTKPSTVEQIMGACMLARRDDLAKLGGFDEDYFIWFEDIELCLAYAKRDWPIMYYPDATFLHHEGASFCRANPIKNQWRFLASLRTFARKHWSRVWWLVFLVFTPIALILTIIGLLAGARPKTQSELG